MLSTITSIVTCVYPSIMSGPRTLLPTANAPSSFTPNHELNSRVSVSARQTRARGARSTISFSILSVDVMCNLQVAYTPRRTDMQPKSCLLRPSYFSPVITTAMASSVLRCSKLQLRGYLAGQTATMTERPESLLKRPEQPRQPDPLRDPLSDVLKSVQLRGAVFFALESSSPWSNAMPDGATLAPVLVPHAQQVISFHVITQGACWGGLLDGPQVRMEAGDVVVFPRGDGYFMSFVRQQPPPPDVDQAFAFMRGMIGGQLPFSVKFGGGGSEQVGAICGFLGCDARPFNPLIATLPRVLHMKGAARAPEDRLT